MSKKSKTDAVGVIEIGSSEMRLKISEVSKGSCKVVDSLTYPLSLGRDTFDNGKISFEKIEKACVILKNFLIAAKGYGVENIRTVATTAVREASNRSYILDQIKIKTGLDVKVLDDEEEKRYIKTIMFSGIDKKYLESALMVYMGTGSISISVLESGYIQFMQNIKIGSLRISELFYNIYEHSQQIYTVIEEYLNSITDVFRQDVPVGTKYLLTSGHEISLIAKILGSKKDSDLILMSKKSFIELYNNIKTKTFESISQEYDISLEKAELLYSAVCMYVNLLRFVKDDSIIAQEISLSDAIIFEMLYPAAAEKKAAEFTKNTIINARTMAKRFRTAEAHYKSVEKFSLKIFDKLKKLHGLGEAERLYLQIACILHDIGKAINIKSHASNSYHIINSLDISGLSSSEKDIIANIAYYHANMQPMPHHENYMRLNENTQMTVSKLVAILKLGDALARSDGKKYNEISAKISDEQLIVTINTDFNIDLEQWAFDEKRGFFEEVFGIKAVLNKKKVTK